MAPAGRTQAIFPFIQQSPKRLLACCVIFICLIPLSLNILGVDFSSQPKPLSPADMVDGNVNTDALFYAVAGAMHHALLEWSAVSIAMLATLASFFHYSVRKDITVPIIGMALLSAGLVDAFHTLAATRIIQASAPNTDFIPFTWAISRIFNASIMIAGASISLWVLQSSLHLNNHRQQIGIFLLSSLLFLGLSYLVVQLAATSSQLPQTMFPNALVTRPFDVLPLALFMAGGTLFWLWYKKEQSAIKWALVLSIIPAIFTQLHMAFGSTALFDNHFNISLVLKNVAYGCIFLGILIDLIHLSPKKTKQMREEEPNESRTYIDGITEAVPALLAYVDSQQQYKFANQNYASWFNLDKHSILNKTINEVVGNITYKKLSPYIQRSLAGETSQFNTQISYKHGTRHVHATYTPDKDKDNNVVGFFISVEDISYIKKAEQQVKELAWRMEFALDAPGIGIWDFNLLTRELIWDKRMYQIFGVDEAVLPDTFNTWKSGLHPDDLEKTLTSMNTSAIHGNDFNIEFRIIWPNGQIRHISAHAKVLTDSQGKNIRIVGTNYDITEQKILQTEREIALLEAQKSANLKSEFLASMSHEIRTPMNGVLGMLGLLLRSDLSVKQQHYATLARSSADSLLILINDILDFSKIEAGKLDLEIIDFDLRHQLGEFSEAMALRAQEKGLEIILDVSQANYSMVRGDPGRIRQVFTNLVSNAIKFTQQGEILISAKIEPDESNNLIFYGSVSDTGIGIPKEKQGDLFGVFTQVDTSTTRKFGGTGLGLAIVKQLCELMQGSISVHSVEGQGCRFDFNIRLQTSSHVTEALPQIKLSDKNILIVDDNETNREVLKGQLELWGARVCEAESGPAALEILKKYRDRPFSAAFLDMQMSGMDGAMLGEKIRQQPVFDQMPMIIMTSIGERGDAQYFADLGFSAYFPKPTTVSDLYKALAIVIDGGDAFKTALPLVTKHNIRSLSGQQPFVNQFNNSHLLLVEDNSINVEVILGMLEDINISVDAVASGLEALSALKNSPNSAPYDLILMDCQMPDMDGYEATIKIREGLAGQLYQTIPILALTANAMKGDRDKCLSIGMNDYLSKPLSYSLLEEKLLQWLPIALADKPQETPMQDNKTAADIAIIEKTEPENDYAPDVWDMKAALKRVGGRPDRVKTLINMFLSDMPDRMKELQNSIDNNQDNVLITAHTIKGVAGNLSGTQVFKQADILEQAAKSNSQHEINKHWPLLESEYNNLCVVFRSYLES